MCLSGINEQAGPTVFEPSTDINHQQHLKVRSVMVGNGVTNRQIAKETGVRENYVYMILAGERTGYRIRRAIAQACKVNVADLWPDTPIQYREAA